MVSSNKGSVQQRKLVKGMDQEKDGKLCTPEKINSFSKKRIGCTCKDFKGQKYNLLSYHELPGYMKDNEYILNYYRADWPLKQAFFSVFRWHNETLNVWTHLLGFLLFLVLTLANVKDVPQVADFMTVFAGQYPSANISKNFSLGATKLIDLKQESRLKIDTTSPATTYWPFYVYLSGSMFCLLSSSVCHLFCCHSHDLNLLLLQMDYVGITVMIITSYFPAMYYIFQCTPHWQVVYLVGITVVGICTIVTLLTPAFSTGKYRSFRAMLFVSMGLIGLIPAVHAVIVNWNDPHRNVTLAYESVMALSYLTGTVFYVCRIPERWKPGFFDLAGQSHQIFHVFVVLGALSHYGAAQLFLRYRGQMGCDK